MPAATILPRRRSEPSHLLRISASWTTCHRSWEPPVSWLDFKRTMDEGRAYARKMTTIDEAGEIQKYLAWELGIDSYHVYEFISGRKEATEALKQQIASLVKNLPNWHQRNEALLLAGVREPYPKFASADRVGGRAGAE